jgi:ParB family chromosome partitioning protein
MRHDGKPKVPPTSPEVNRIYGQVRDEQLRLRRVEDLKPHPANQQIYGDAEEPDPELVDNIRQHGVLQAILIVKKTNTIISGNRRWIAAKAAGLKEVPVEYFEEPRSGPRRKPKEEDILEVLVHSNKQRVKTNEQIAREGKALLRVEKIRAKRRNKEAAARTNAKRQGQEPAPVETFPQADKGKARDKVGEALGVSGRTAEKMVEVVDEVDRLRAEGKPEQAEELRQTLNDRGAEPAHQKPRVFRGEQPKPKKTKKQGSPKPSVAAAATPELAPDRPSHGLGSYRYTVGTGFDGLRNGWSLPPEAARDLVGQIVETLIGLRRQHNRLNRECPDASTAKERRVKRQMAEVDKQFDATAHDPLHCALVWLADAEDRAAGVD